MRNIMEHVLNECVVNGIHVPACSFDGQWHNIVVRSSDGKPLTLLQLQKDIWKDVQVMTKAQLEKELRNIPNKPTWEMEVTLQAGDNKEHRVIVCTNGGIQLPKTSVKGWITNKKRRNGSEKNHDKEECDDKSPTLLDAVSEEVIEAISEEGDQYPTVLIHNTGTSLVEEIASCNVNTDLWILALIDMQEEHTSCQGDERGDMNSLVDTMDVFDNNMVTESVYQLDETENTEVFVHSESMGEITVVDESEPDFTSGETEDEIVHANQSSESNCSYKFTDDDTSSILPLLQTDGNANKSGKWNGKTKRDVLDLCKSAVNLRKARDVDIRVLVRYLNKQKITAIKEYQTKTKKIEALCKILGIPETIGDEGTSYGTTFKSVKSTKKASPRHQKVKTLVNLSSIALKRVPKAALNVIYSEYIWPSRLAKWRQETPLSDSVKVDQLGVPDYWFYVPEYSESRKQLEVKCIDSTHLLTRTRRKSCKGGIDNLENRPWMKVAKQGKTFLTPVMITDIVDPMSMSMALTHFGKGVQNAMRENGDFESASFCEDIHTWWRAEDEPGIPAAERILMRCKLRKRLLRDIDFGSFPPPGMYVKGWPSQLWEALIANIDANAILYALCKTGSYNPRAFSSMMGETFFAELTNQDRGSHGTVSVDDFGRYISKTIEQMQIKLDPSRHFTYRTTTGKAYKLVESVAECTSPNDVKSLWKPERFISSIIPRNHFFDSSARSRIRGKRREGTVKTGRNDLQKGALGVRWETARRNESKMLVSKRMGLD